MNWGYKILTVIMVFLTAMGTMITIAMRQNNDLIDEQYYVRELQHQQLIDAGNELRSLGAAPRLLLEKDTLVVSIPAAAATNVADGTLSFICPSDKHCDRTFAFLPDTNGLFRLSAKGIAKGSYLVRLSWKSRHILYYNEQSFRID